MTTDKKQEDSSSFLMIFMFMFTMMVMFDKSLRAAFGNFVGTVFHPIIGFNNQYPLITLLCGGLIMTLFSIGTRHFFTDWVAMTRNQKIMGAFNKEMREAQMNGQNSKLEKMKEQQRELTQQQMLQTSKQMRSMMVTMLVMISIFTWLSLFISTAPSKIFSVPWNGNISFQRFGPFAKIIPIWIWAYSLVTIPIGQIFQRILKRFSFTKRLHELNTEEIAGETA